MCFLGFLATFLHGDWIKMFVVSRNLFAPFMLSIHTYSQIISVFHRERVYLRVLRTILLRYRSFSCSSLETKKTVTLLYYLEDPRQWL